MSYIPKNCPPSLQAIFDYHQNTKHHFQSHARGPGYLDWETQPNPFRRYTDAPMLPLEKISPANEPLYDTAFIPGKISPASLTLQSLSQLFYNSLALSAWKCAGPNRWALRVNPSSGNLHPTEGYLICGPIEGLCPSPMVCHYAPKEHGLEVRATLPLDLWENLCEKFSTPVIFVGLTSIHWREAWKYGERAYRYCAHDVGHAIGAISIAAAGLGWQAKILDDLSSDELSLLMGTFCAHSAEPEEPDMLIALSPSKEPITETSLPQTPILTFESLNWQGSPNLLSPHHVEWGIEALAKAARKPRSAFPDEPIPSPPPLAEWPDRPLSLAKILRERRSAMSMDGHTSISRDQFYRILQKTLAGGTPFTTLSWKPYLHLAIFIHRVEGLAPGLYLLVRDSSQTTPLREALAQTHRWERPAGCPEPLEFYLLVEADAQEAARQISCSQDIASDGCFSLGMIAQYEAPLHHYGPWFYPRLFWEAGIIGQVLYLEAEAAGIRGTGIGCYFDDPMHHLLGLRDRQYQDLYHFTVGGPIEDPRLTSLPPYDINR